MQNIYITGTGFWIPEDGLTTNDEVVNSYNAFVDTFNLDNAEAISAGSLEALSHSSSEFIEKASGIKTRYLYDKHNCLDPNRMKPKTRPELPDNTSILAEMGIESAKKAITNAGITVDDIDGIILGTSHSARNYPAIAIEIQEALGINGYAYDMLVGCSSTTFAISNAYSDIASGLASTILVINPELTSPGNDFRIRDSHFIFGDACVATIVQGNLNNPKDVFQIKDRELVTQFSNNIRSDFSYMNRTDDLNRGDEVMFRQNGRSVFKEVCPMVVEIIMNQLSKLKFDPNDVKRFWLHQANGNMINFVAKKLKGEDYDPNAAPMILEKYGNVASAGSVIAFHETKDDFQTGEMGVICSFGAGYSICSLVVEKV